MIEKTITQFKQSYNKFLTFNTEMNNRKELKKMNIFRELYKRILS